jgi:hypothetical protein
MGRVEDQGGGSNVPRAQAGENRGSRAATQLRLRGASGRAPLDQGTKSSCHGAATVALCPPDTTMAPRPTRARPRARGGGSGR